MKLSICAVFHNQKKYIERCLSSILQQKTSHSFEILLGDDKSTDGTWEELRKYQDRFPGIMTCHRIDTGLFNPVSKNHRSGLNRSNLYDKIKGQYFAFVDGDDFIIDDNRFDMQIAKLDEHPDCTICAGNTAIYIDGEKPEYVKLMNAEGLIPDGSIITGEEYLNGYFFHNSSMLIRKQPFDIFSKFKRELFEDYALTVFHLQYGSIVYIDKPFLAYIQQPEGIYTALSAFEKNARSICAVADHLKYFPNYRKQHLKSFEDMIPTIFFHPKPRVLSEDGRKLLSTSGQKIFKEIIERKGAAGGAFLHARMLLLLTAKKILRKLFGYKPFVFVRIYLDIDNFTLR